MQDQLSFSDAQIRILLELLRQEQAELPHEMHHTDNRELHGELNQRLKMVDQLIAQLEHAPVH